jgi:hypothetical protein
MFAPGLTATGERRVRVIDGRVACWRIGSVNLDRCQECDYLLRVEEESAHRLGHGYVVCADDAADAERDWVW